MAKQTQNGHITTATYIRASTSDQTESPDSQRKLAARVAPDHGLKLEFEYLDFAVSGGRTKTRDGLQRLLADAKRGLFQAVLVRDLSRLSRTNSLKAAAKVIGPLLDSGVTIYTCTHGDLKLDSVTGRIMLAVMLEFDGEENVKRAFNVVNGQMTAAAKGSWIGAAPYGYQVEGERHAKRLVIEDDDKAATVKRVFRQFVDGESTQAIADSLNGEGVSAPSGGRWCRHTIAKMLRRPAYVGDHRFNYESNGRYYRLTHGKPELRSGHLTDGEQPTTIRNDESDWIVIRNHWPALVERRTWDRVQRRIERNAEFKPHPTTRTWLLSGLLRCACGAKRPMVGKYLGKTKRYRCESCRATVVEAEVIEKLGDCIRAALSPRNVKTIREQVERLTRKTAKQPAADIHTLERKLDQYEQRLAEVSADMIPRIEKQIRTVEQRLSTARQQRQAVQNHPQRSVDEIMSGLFRLPKLLATTDDRTLKATLPEIFAHVLIKCVSNGKGTGRRWRLSGGTASCPGGNGVEPSSPPYQGGILNR